LAKLKKWRDEDVVDDTSMYTGSSKILETVIDKEVADYRAQFLLAQLYESRREHWRAAVSFSIAAKDANLRQRAFVSAARCFAKANHNSAAWSCLRRAKEQSLHEEDLRVLYNLARSLEDVGNLASARLYYDILLTWEPRYRDVARRAQSIDEGQTESDAGRLGEVDYTGLTVNLLGSDAPRFNQVDPSLHRVMQARARELHVSDSERARFEAVFKKYYAGPDGIREKTKNDLGYDVESYIKYDFLLPEDEIKKELERLNTLALLEGNEKVTRSLDIGAATGRWPRTFASQGIEAYGIDIEEKAIEYAERKLTAADRERGFPDLRVANALALPFEDGMFCLATCMMGTFSHIAKSDHLKFFSECRRVLRQDGLLLISTWDVECRHQSYLSMYTVAEKQKIDENSLTRQQLWNLTNSEGFDVQAQVPICLIPDVLSFELGIKELDAEALREMWSIDLAARSNFPEMHGEMFLTLARRR
jgi:SAM-dependent methyltransferase